MALLWALIRVDPTHFEIHHARYPDHVISYHIWSKAIVKRVDRYLHGSFQGNCEKFIRFAFRQNISVPHDTNIVFRNFENGIETQTRFRFTSVRKARPTLFVGLPPTAFYGGNTFKMRDSHGAIVQSAL